MFRGADALDFPDVNSLFALYNAAYFESLLSDVVLQWSSRLTVAAGVCIYKGTRRCEVAPITIRLSSQLLQYRSPQDIASVLLHEMIHAYLFRLKVFETDPHGPVWRSCAARINWMERENGVVITPYHNFTQEVEYAREQQKKRAEERRKKALEREERRKRGFQGKPGILGPSSTPAGMGRREQSLRGPLPRVEKGRNIVSAAAGKRPSRNGERLVPIDKFAFPRNFADAFRITNFEKIATALKDICDEVHRRFDGQSVEKHQGALSQECDDARRQAGRIFPSSPCSAQDLDSDTPETIIMDGGESCVSISDSDDGCGVISMYSDSFEEEPVLIDLSRSLSSQEAKA